VFFIEAIMFSLYFATGSTYFANRSDHPSASEIRFEPNSCSSFKGHVEKPIRVAVFGGSSSAGFSSPISFFQLLCDYNFANNNIKITNYAEDGAPFSGFQSKIIKSVMDDYDILIIYSGHNELWNQVYLRDDYTIFPNGMRTPKPKSVHIRHRQKLNYIEGEINLKPIINRSMLVEHSRIYYFIRRVLDKIELYVSGDLEKMIKSKNFYYGSDFITSNERQNMIKSYKENIIEISNKLRSGQKLVISTVMSNDLFPPIADVYQVKYKKEMDVLNKKLKKAYSFLLNNEYDKLQEIVNTLPKTAHRYYLEGMVCLNTNVDSEDRLPKECLSKLIKSRELDRFQLRVIPEINSFIRQFRHRNVITVDPVQDLISKANSIEEYKEYFVDFQHPSQLGHALIAENILLSLAPYRSISRIYGKDLCGVSWKSNGKLIHIKSSYIQCVDSYKDNIKWLENFSNIQPVSYQYDDYKSKSKTNLSTVEGERN
jgi:hypothetical protein